MSDPQIYRSPHVALHSKGQSPSRVCRPFTAVAQPRRGFQHRQPRQKRYYCHEMPLMPILALTQEEVSECTSSSNDSRSRAIRVFANWKNGDAAFLQPPRVSALMMHFVASVELSTLFPRQRCATHDFEFVVRRRDRLLLLLLQVRNVFCRTSVSLLPRPMVALAVNLTAL